ncbi:MAG: hypothetical protein LAP87_08420 [Acidobacteriia bacterium]|nr:hypothetical protein [Terriglobia bacterium]
MRAVSTSLMAALVVVALFWGNCFSCPQLLLAMQSHQPAHGCCHGKKQAPVTCQTQQFHQFLKADAGHAPAVPLVAELLASPSPVPLPHDRTSASVPAPHAPPGLSSLYSTLRI